MRFPYYARSDSTAIKIAESFYYSFALVFGPLGDRDLPDTVLPVPAALVKGRDEVSVGAIAEYEDSKPPYLRRFEFPHTAIGSASFADQHTVAAAWRATRVLALNAHLFDAVRFLKVSEEHFYVWPGQVAEAASYPPTPPETAWEQSRLEIALLNAFKAVEATIGDPPSQDTKLFSALRSIGLDPMEPAGYQGEQPIHSVVRHMALARDKKSAHGRTKNSHITIPEMLDYQACARNITVSAVEHVLGRALR